MSASFTPCSSVRAALSRGFDVFTGAECCFDELVRVLLVVLHSSRVSTFCNLLGVDMAWFAQCSMLATSLVGAAAFAAAVPGQGTWETTLKARDIHGNPVALGDSSTVFLYDTTLNVTWLANMNQAGPMSWSAAVAWVKVLSVGGYTDWRLPTIIDSGVPGGQCTYSGTDCGYNVHTEVNGQYSEWAHLFYVTLGNRAEYDTNGVRRAGTPGVDFGLTNTATFQHMQGSRYWSGTEYVIPDGSAWRVGFSDGAVGSTDRDQPLYPGAVRFGDVTPAVPEPGSWLLMLAGIGMLVAAQRRR